MASAAPGFAAIAAGSIIAGPAAPDTTSGIRSIGYPTITQCDDGTVVVAYHEYTSRESPIQAMWCMRFQL